MKRFLLKLLALYCLIGLASCAAFYTRHYTKGLFYDGFAHGRQPNTRTEKAAPDVAIPQGPDSAISKTQDALPGEKTVTSEKKQPASASRRTPYTVAAKGVRPGTVFSSPLTTKALKPLHRDIRAAQREQSIIGKAALYILALVLCVGIVALAVYFLPSILLPAQVASAFTSILLIGAIVLLCVFGFLIYTLIGMLADLFKQKRTPGEDDL